MSGINIIANSSGIDLIRFRFYKTGTFFERICVKQVYDVGGQTFVREIAEQVIAGMSSGLQFYVLY